MITVDKRKEESDDCSISFEDETDVTPYSSYEDLVDISHSGKNEDCETPGESENYYDKKRKLLVQQFLKEMAPFCELGKSHSSAVNASRYTDKKRIQKGDFESNSCFSTQDMD